jgi:hypothetical protein
MVAYVFDKIITKGVQQGQIPGRTADARNWFRNAASRAARAGAESVISKNAQKQTSDIGIGEMGLFTYDAKHKAKLPYFDKYPLIFKLEDYGDSFLGMNLHYLPPQLRARLMDALYDTATNQRYDNSTVLRINYKILSSAAKYKAFKPCVKKYLKSQMRSRFIKIDSVEWDIALFLPIAQFSGGGKNKVYADSRKTI